MNLNQLFDLRSDFGAVKSHHKQLTIQPVDIIPDRVSLHAHWSQRRICVHDGAQLPRALKRIFLVNNPAHVLHMVQKHQSGCSFSRTRVVYCFSRILYDEIRLPRL